MPFRKLPIVDNCCRCITELKTATAIIAVLSIVTSPAVTWAVVRHSFVIRVSCFVKADNIKPDVVDINLHNILSFGFGANAGLGPSCLGKKSNISSSSLAFLSDAGTDSNPLVKAVKYIGFVVLAADIIFVLSGLILLVHLYKDGETRLPHFVKCFMYCALVAIILSFFYGLLYCATCLIIGGSFPIFELTFAFIDLGIWSLWLYFIIVLRSYLYQIDLQLERLRHHYYYAFLDYVEVARAYAYQKYYDWISNFFRRFSGIAWFLDLIDRLYNREREIRTQPRVHIPEPTIAYR